MKRKSSPPSKDEEPGRGRARVAPSPSRVERPPSPLRDPSSPSSGQGADLAGSSSFSRGDNGSRQVEESERGTRRVFIPDDEMLLTRPNPDESKKGSYGQKIQLLANYFQVRLRKDPFLMNQFHVNFIPDSLVEPWPTFVKKKLLKVHGDELGPYIFDGHILFAPGMLVAPNEAKLLNSHHPTTNEPIQLTITFTKELNSNDPACIQFYNIIIRKCMGELNLKLLQRSYFDNQRTISIPQHHLELWPGFSTSMRQHENNLLFCVEATHKVLRQETAFDIMDKIRHQFPNKDEFRAKIKEELVGRYVMTQYNKRILRVDEILWDERPTNTFKREDKKDKSIVRQISYIDYYKEVYKKDIVNVKYPMLLSKKTKRDIRRGVKNDSNLVPEFCQMTGLTDNMRADYNLMRNLNEHLQMVPTKRVARIGQLMNKIDGNDVMKKFLFDWNIKFNRNLVQVEGRVLFKEDILFENGKETVNDKADWTGGFRNCRSFSIVNLTKWVILTPARERQQVEGFLDLMRKVSRTLGFRFTDPDIIELTNRVSPSEYSTEISRYMGKRGGDVNMFMIILPSNQLPNYACIKKHCCIDYGIPSQCIVAKTFQNKGLMSVATKVVIQMIAKLGGEPWSISMPLKKMMVMGYNVYHGATKQGGKTSWGALVSTISPSYGKFHSKVAKNEGGGNTLYAHIQSALRAYRKEIGEYPDRIAFYRDGVSDGQLEHVFNTELTKIKQAIQNVYTEGNQEPPKFLFVVVTKKIRTKFFRAITENQDTYYENPPFGTIVDDVVTLPNRYDFYLVSQIARQGTVSPTSYNIVADTFGLDADKIQRLTYKLCHMYYNWSGTVSVPAVCQYAHKLAMLTGTALDAEIHENLSNLLFYL